MSSFAIILTIVGYLLLLLLISYRSGRRDDNNSFFIANRATSWYMATFAMIGAAMSGVTFISVPGSVATDSFSYLQMVIGFTIGQFIVAFVLIPLFYRRGVVSLYQYLEQRFGITTHLTGAWCFLVAKVVAASLKVYIVCAVMQLLLFDGIGAPFFVNVLSTMLVVWLYTRWGGVKSLIPTDSLQSLCLVAAVVISIYWLCSAMGLSLGEAYDQVAASSYSRIWFFDDPNSARYFWKMVAGGALCLVAMTGLDQDMMQRNMSCRSVRESQVNIVLTALCQIVVIALFLVLGVLLYRYMDFAQMSLPDSGDKVFALVATQGGLPLIVGVVFIAGLISSTFSSAGSALTSLTTSFTLDIMPQSVQRDESALRRLRERVHIVMALIMVVTILLFEVINNDGVINLIFRIAGYTYGPILGLFVFGIATKRRVNERFVPIISIVAPLLSYALQWTLARYCDYHIGFELLGYNALFVIFGLAIVSRKAK